MNTISAAPFGPSGTPLDCAAHTAGRVTSFSAGVNKVLLIGGLTFLLTSRAFAPILMELPAPQDDPVVRRNLIGGGVFESDPLNRHARLKPLEEEYQQLVHTRIRSLTRADVARCFGPVLFTATNWWAMGASHGGPQLRKYPDDLVLPLYVGKGLGISGLHSTEPAANKNHTDLQAIDKLGYIEIYYAHDGESVHAAVLYNRADKHFVPLRSTDDFESRLEWDKAHFALIKKWLDEHLPKTPKLKK